MPPVWLKYIYSVLCALTSRPMPAAARSRLGFQLVECIRQNRYVIGVVGVGNCFLRGTFWFFFLSARNFDFIDRCSKHVVQTDDKEVWGKCVSLQYSSYNVEVVCVSIRRTHFHFGVFIENHYGCDGTDGWIPFLRALARRETKTA